MNVARTVDVFDRLMERLVPFVTDAAKVLQGERDELHLQRLLDAS